MRLSGRELSTVNLSFRNQTPKMNFVSLILIL